LETTGRRIPMAKDTEEELKPLRADHPSFKRGWSVYVKPSFASTKPPPASKAGEKKPEPPVQPPGSEK
jgi:hypothetical protein